jgi:predicted alpha/beta hydrolase
MTPCCLIEIDDDSEEPAASIFRIEEYYMKATIQVALLHVRQETKTCLSHTHLLTVPEHRVLSACLAYSSTLKMEAVFFSETLNFHQTT